MNDTIIIPDHVRALAEARWEARSMKKWKESDTLRDQLAEQGWFIKDGKDGYELESNA